MLRPRAMILRPRRIGWIEPFVLPIRKFSISATLAEDSRSPGQTNPPKSSPSQPRKLQIPPALLKFKSSNSEKLRPRRFVDARALAASRSGSQPANLLKGPNRLGGRGGASPRARKPQYSASAAKKDRKPSRRRRNNEDDGHEVHTGEIESVYRELAEESKPTITRYQPQLPSLQSLSETWPSIPTDVTATAAGVAEKLSLLSERYPNGYVPPYELGKRLFEGKYVRFTSEAEKAEALEAAKKYAQEAADKLSQEKGELVDPQPINFQGGKDENHKFLIESLAQGKYPTVDTEEANGSPVVANILRNLRNNETYQVAGKRSQFMAKLGSLLVENRPVKRA
ncbi:hypothetical protein BDV12DRAFT_150977 [Aspergillus spectabilis]